jgi:hypothetical protein
MLYSLNFNGVGLKFLHWSDDAFFQGCSTVMIGEWSTIEFPYMYRAIRRTDWGRQQDELVQESFGESGRWLWWFVV